VDGMTEELTLHFYLILVNLNLYKNRHTPSGSYFGQHRPSEKHLLRGSHSVTQHVGTSLTLVL
jgi:hypothetical protein